MQGYGLRGWEVYKSERRERETGKLQDSTSVAYAKTGLIYAGISGMPKTRGGKIPSPTAVKIKFFLGRRA